VNRGTRVAKKLRPLAMNRLYAIVVIFVYTVLQDSNSDADIIKSLELTKAKIRLLPKNGLLVQFDEHSGAGREQLKLLKNLKNLTFLEFDHVEIATEDLRLLDGLTTLEILSFSRMPIDPYGFAQLKALPNLATLNLSSTKGKADDLLRGAHRFPKLRCISIFNCEFNGSGFKHLERNKGLMSVNVHSCNISDISIRPLEKLVSVDFLWLNGCELGDASIGTFLKMPALSSLSLRDTKLTDSGLRNIASKPGMRLIQTAGSDVSEACISELKRKYPKLIISNTRDD
jgi:hypothetical protein